MSEKTENLCEQASKCVGGFVASIKFELLNPLDDSNGKIIIEVVKDEQRSFVISNSVNLKAKDLYKTAYFLGKQIVGLYCNDNSERSEIRFNFKDGSYIFVDKCLTDDNLRP